MSTINIQHQGITLEWVIKDPNVADKVVSALWALITDSGAIPAEWQGMTPFATKRKYNRPPRRNKITPEFLAEVAELYRKAPENAKMRTVRETLAVSSPTASNYVYQARQHGLLEPSTTHGIGGRKPRLAEATLTDGVEATAR